MEGHISAVNSSTSTEENTYMISEDVPVRDNSRFDKIYLCVSDESSVNISYPNLGHAALEKFFMKITFNLEFLLAVIDSIVQEENVRAITLKQNINTQYLKNLYKIFSDGYFKIKAIHDLYHKLIISDVFYAETLILEYSEDLVRVIIESLNFACKYMIQHSKGFRKSLLIKFDMRIGNDFVLFKNSTNKPIPPTYLSEPQYLTAASTLEHYENIFRSNA